MGVEDKTFWSEKDGKIIINHNRYVDFLKYCGFAIMEIDDKSHELVKVKGNIIQNTTERNIIRVTMMFLKIYGDERVREAFTRGITSYTNPKKLLTLPNFEYEFERDKKSTIKLYFKCKYVEITVDSIVTKDYSSLSTRVHFDRIMNHDIELISDTETSTFERFCFKISNENVNRFNTLKSVIGYLLHSYQDPSNTRAIIVVDENLSFEGEANGGTGKGILASAIGKCRNMVTIDGKSWCGKSNFKNQQIELSTDVLFFDDVHKDFSLEDLYSMITSGITVEKKFKQPFFIAPENAPKILISSNYMVKGTGGSTDRRRRFELEIFNYYDDSFSPHDDFEHLFFQDWDKEELNRFYMFMFECGKYYLQNGLVTYKSDNLIRNKIVAETSLEFHEFIIKNSEENKWLDKRKLLEDFNKQQKSINEISSHQFTKFLKSYAKHKHLKYCRKSSGGKYLFLLESKKGSL